MKIGFASAVSATWRNKSSSLHQRILSTKFMLSSVRCPLYRLCLSQTQPPEYADGRLNGLPDLHQVCGLYLRQRKPIGNSKRAWPRT